MFLDTQGKGFRITFANGFGVSVQWGLGNYCDNRSMSVVDWASKPASESMIKSATAEVAVFTPQGDMAYITAWGDQVKGYCTPAEVLALMNEVAAYPRDKVLPTEYPPLESALEEVTDAALNVERND